MKVLAGDIGGTKTWLLIAHCQGGTYTPVYERRFDSAAYRSLTTMVREFLAAADERTALPVEGACFGVAGPVSSSEAGDTARTTNLPWHVASTELAGELGLARVRLINDFQATGYGIEALGAQDLATLQEGAPQVHAPRVIIGAGTGLGMGVLSWQGGHYEPLPSEGGHADFAPTDDEQDGLLRFLRARFGRVSVERVVSGPGLTNILDFLRETGAAPASPALEAAMANGDPAAAISRAALNGSDAAATRALDLFVRAYGARAGDLALTAVARGGVYIGGGIAPKILQRLQAGDFLTAFNAKGRMSALCQAMPVHVITNPKVGLLGAALRATRA
jgi:glucokinase